MTRRRRLGGLIVLPPVITGVSPASVAAGAQITIAGTRFKNGATVLIGGTAAGGVIFDSALQIRATVPAISTGLKNIIVTNPDGLTSGNSGNGLFTVTFDLATLPLSAWVEATDYQRVNQGAGTFRGLMLGRASAGGSGTHPNQNFDIAGSTQVPTIGANLNGLQTVAFDRTLNQTIAGSFNSPTPFASNGAVVTYSGWLLVFWNSAGMPDHAPSTGYSNASWLCDGNVRWNLSGRPGAGTPKAQITFWNGAGFDGPEAALVDNAWNLITWRSSETLTEIAVGDGAWVGINHGALTADGTGINRLGESITGVFATMRMASYAASRTIFDNATFTNIRAAIRAKWGNTF